MNKNFFPAGIAILLLSTCLTPAAEPPGIAGPQANGFATPNNQFLSPAGRLVELPGMRPTALALSPDGQLLVTSGRTNELLVLDPEMGAVRDRIRFPRSKIPQTEETDDSVAQTILHPDKRAQLSFTGLTFSPDGSRIYLANVNGDIKVFAVGRDEKVSALACFALPPANAPRRAAEIPAGIAVSRDGRKIYVACNLGNRLAEIDAATGQVLRQWDAGVEPFGVALAGHKAYVSNWGGRRPDANSVTGPAGRGTLVRVDERGIASEGSVSIIDLEHGGEDSEVLTGLHACAIAAAPNGRHVVVANAGSDTLSVIETRTGKIVETICARRQPGDLFGAQPNALAFDRSGKTLFVCNGTQNAVAVIRFRPKKSEWLGLIPTGWFPAAIAFDRHRNGIEVASLKSFSHGKKRVSNGKIEFNSGQYYGSISLANAPSAKQLAALTQSALDNLRYPLLAQAKLSPRARTPPRPVPERAGEPSVFHHVLYIIKENCAYDQMLGDLPGGNGDLDLCVFGERVAPNMHKAAREFTLLDNTYCCGILSADGHEWSTTAIATDYLEREFAGWPRSYPAGNQPEEIDAMAYSPAGFIWDDALSHGKTIRDFGEFTQTHVHWKNPARTNTPTFLDNYNDFMDGSNGISYWSEGSVTSLRPCVETNTIGWNLNVPDLYRARQFIRALHGFEQNGQMPDLTLLWLPHDHTSGTKFGFPTPAACVADNDLSFGRVLDAVSHSSFWKDTCIVAIEDDPQNGWDHVNGYRTTAYVVSPYTKRSAVVSTQYNQTSLLRTMELILGLPPMNQMDATATPMFDCFTDTPDFTPFTAVSNNVPLNTMNPAPKKVADRQLRKDAYISDRLPFEKEDQCPADVLSHIIWRAMKGSQIPYPASAAARVEDDD